MAQVVIGKVVDAASGKPVAGVRVEAWDKDPGPDMSQRGIELVMTGTGAGTVNVDGPPNANLCPPGWYLLFVLDANRVPSVARWVRVTP